MVSNFDFLTGLLEDLRHHAAEAERLVKSSPRLACTQARFTLEQAVHWLYLHDAYLRRPYDESLNGLIHEQTFRDNLKPGLWPKIRAIQKLGNRAAHDGGDIPEGDALHAVRELFHVLYWISRSYAPDAANHPKATWDAAKVAAPGTTPDTRELEQLEQRLAEQERSLEEKEEALRARQRDLDALQAELHARKEQNAKVADAHDYDEARTRKQLIDVLLREAGWDPHAPNVREVEVWGMPSDSGRGFVDYVLWGEDGVPLAVVEAKKTSANADVGKQQAKLYADCITLKYGRRPVIFYTNGDDTWLWDDADYPPRRVSGFYSRRDLEELHYRRKHRRALATAPIERSITDRPYQIEAIRRVGEHFDAKHRRALLVMATGTGKTRTAISLVSMFLGRGWAKRVLFLADRDALVKQATNAFTKHLAGVVCADIRSPKADGNAQVVTSTHQTMIGLIGEQRDGVRRFSPGHFDVVFIDEAHRSIYARYGDIFDYFDGLLVGLTATPRDEVHRDTYRVFELPAGQPTFAYDLADAVKDGYLVPPITLDVPFRFMTEGIAYDALSDEEKEAYDDLVEPDDDGLLPRHIAPAALNRWLFNMDTVDGALSFLHDNGIRVEGGNRLGKTIIFARSRQHARFIVERYDAMFPAQAGKACLAIDYMTAYSDSILADFSRADTTPDIAVSVDMLDTGIDVPEVVNLVFFKPVRSRVKFHQMLGRGTRLRPDLFGPGEHKTEFAVFDLCGNARFFGLNATERAPSPPQSLTGRVFRRRIALAEKLRGADDAGIAAVRARLLDDAHTRVAAMTTANYSVRMRRRQVETFRERERWNRLTDEDVETLVEELAELPTALEPEDEHAVRFDLLMLRLMDALVEQDKQFPKLREQVRQVADALHDKMTLPMVRARASVIDSVCDDGWWATADVAMLEDVRLQLRSLAQFVDLKRKAPLYTNFRDELLEVEFVEMPEVSGAATFAEYRRKVERYIREHEDHIAIAKVKRASPLTPTDLRELERMIFAAEEIGDRAQFEAVYGTDVSLPEFIRGLVGLDRQAAKAAFADYLDGTRFSADQIRFVDMIVDYLTQNGSMDPTLLYEPPFTGVHVQGLDGLFDDDAADRIVELVRRLSRVEEVG